MNAAAAVIQSIGVVLDLLCGRDESSCYFVRSMSEHRPKETGCVGDNPNAWRIASPGWACVSKSVETAPCPPLPYVLRWSKCRFKGKWRGTDEDLALSSYPCGLEVGCGTCSRKPRNNLVNIKESSPHLPRLSQDMGLARAETGTRQEPPTASRSPSTEGIFPTGYPARRTTKVMHQTR